MGKLNEIQQQTTQSYGSNSFTTTIKEDTVEFDSAKDKFTFKDPVEVPSINVNGQESVAFTSEDRVKLDNLQTPMQIKGRVDSVADLENIENPSVGDTYLVGLSGSETFEEYVCIGFSGSPEQAEWENVGTTQKQSDWNQNDNTKADYIKNRTHYVETTYETLVNETLSNPTAIGIVYTFLTNATFTFEEGKTYKVTVDGTEYEIEATLNGQVPFPVLVYGDMDPDNPVSGSFYIVAGNSMLISNFASDTEIETVDLKIDGPEETYHTLNDNFISSNIARTSDIKTVSYTSNTEGFTKKIGKISVGSTNYDVKIPLVNYTDYSGSIVTLEEGKFTVCSGTQTSISITWGGTTNVVNYMYAIFTAGENFVMPTSGKSNLSSLTQGTTYFLTVIGDSIKGWNYIFEEMVDLS